MNTTQTVTAEQLTEWASIARESKPGTGRAYIAHVYQVGKLLGAVDCSLEAFKAAIAGNVETRGCLRRCDLKRAFDATLLSASEVTYRGAEFHMVSR